MTHVERERLDRLKLDTDALRALPFFDRMQAYDDFDAATRSRNMAHWYRRVGGPWWLPNFTLEMRASLRAWKRYAAAVRRASERKAA